MTPEDRKVEFMVTFVRQSVAVIGTGLAGAAVAHALQLAGHSVHVFDKSRGPGGRLATRRVEWMDAQCQAAVARIDHGAVGFSASSEAFQTFADLAVEAGWLAKWKPALASGTVLLGGGDQAFVPVPDMPSLCRHLLSGVPASWSFAVEALHRSSLGWHVEGGDVRHDAPFGAVVIALPPMQAAPLIGPYRRDWARRASVVPMQPCWTLMGIADAPPSALGWDLARPEGGPIACVLRNDARPGRARVPGQAHWVVHARPSWSRRHLEQPAAWVQQQLQDALAECLGQPVQWQHSVVHRWRYALPPAQRLAPAEPCWWDAAQGLGVCGDFLGGTGAEGAWLSAQSMTKALLRRASPAADATVGMGVQGTVDA